MAIFYYLLQSLIPRFLVAFIVYIVLRSIYRVTLHPLAKFPGPKRAAISSIYAASWDIPFRTAYVKEFTTWHDKYDSAIVRIQPNELHIRDIDAYNEMYRQGSRLRRGRTIYDLPFTVGSFFNKLDARDGTPHRALYSQAFSRSAVQALEPVLHGHLARFLTRLDEAGDKPVDLTFGFRCLTADNIGRYMYDRPFNFLDAPDFRAETVVHFEELADTFTISWYGGWLFRGIIDVCRRVPRSWLGENGVSATLKIYDICKARITELSKEPIDSRTPNVFHNALNPNIDKGQPKLSIDELAADGLIIFTAGADSTANLLTYTIYHLLRQPDLLSRLRAELAQAIPTSATIAYTSPSPPLFPASWSTLEKLPLLRATIKEGCRIYMGVPGKLPRVVPRKGIKLAGSFIPGGTTISSCSYAYHLNPACYPDPQAFRPERWISDPETGVFVDNGGTDPEKFFMTFSRGSRSCLGTNLAYAELYATVAYLLRNFDLQLHETSDEDMEWTDNFIVVSFGHLKVKVRRLEGEVKG